MKKPTLKQLAEKKRLEKADKSTEKTIIYESKGPGNDRTKYWANMEEDLHKQVEDFNYIHDLIMECVRQSVPIPKELARAVHLLARNGEITTLKQSKAHEWGYCGGNNDLETEIRMEKIKMFAKMDNEIEKKDGQ